MLTCTIGECREPATGRIEVRRDPGDDHPAEIRPVCSDPLCRRIASLSGGDFHVTLTPCEADRAVLAAAGYPDGPDYEALILAEDEESLEGF